MERKLKDIGKRMESELKRMKREWKEGGKSENGRKK